jgi:hypothetical protein
MDRYISTLATMAIVLLTLGMEVGAVEVPYVSGGIGADVREELLAKEKEYNLKVVVAEKSGDYLAGVQTVIESGRKEQVLDATMEGPILMARLAPGTYTIRATAAQPNSNHPGAEAAAGRLPLGRVQVSLYGDAARSCPGSGRNGEFGGNRPENLVGKWDSDRISPEPAHNGSRLPHGNLRA